MRIMIADTETTGFPSKKQIGQDKLENWPRMVQLAYELHDYENGVNTLVKTVDSIIYPDGYEIPEFVTEIHGISTERAKEEGIRLSVVQEVFEYDLLNCDVVVFHNSAFDVNVLDSENYRTYDVPNIWPHVICTKTTTAKWCNFKDKRGHSKQPKLRELYFHLFGEYFDNAHDAKFDVEATTRCFFECVKRGVIKLPEIIK